VLEVDIDIDTLNRRLAARPDDEWSGRAIERDFVARLHATKEDVPKSGIVIDAAAPIPRVVDAILSRCG
jgi:hypothetical protein